MNSVPDNWTLQQKNKLYDPTDEELRNGVYSYMGIVLPTSDPRYMNIVRPQDITRQSDGTIVVPYTKYRVSSTSQTSEDWVRVISNKKAKTSSDGAIVAGGNANSVSIRALSNMDKDVMHYAWNSMPESAKADTKNPVYRYDQTFHNLIDEVSGRATNTMEEAKAWRVGKAVNRIKKPEVDVWFPTPIPYVPSREELKSMLKPGYMRIGYAGFLMPPTDITYMRKYPVDIKPLMRASSSLKRGFGHSSREFQLNFQFDSPMQVNQVLLPLIRQFQRTPFLPIVNSYFNDTLDIDAVALQAIQYSTIPGFPGRIDATIQMAEFNWTAYMPGEANFDTTICYPLLKIWCEANTHTQKIRGVPLANSDDIGFDGVLKWYLPTEEYLAATEEKATKPYSDLSAIEKESVDIENVMLGVSYLSGNAIQELEDNYGLKSVVATENLKNLHGRNYAVNRPFFVGNVDIIPPDVDVPGFPTKAVVIKLSDPRFIVEMLKRLADAGTSEDGGDFTNGAVVYGNVELVPSRSIGGAATIRGSVMIPYDMKDIVASMESVISTSSDSSVSRKYLEALDMMRGAYFVIPKQSIGMLNDLVTLYEGGAQAAIKAGPSAAQGRLILEKMWKEYIFPSAVITRVTATTENLLTSVQPQMTSSPLHQYMGRADSYFTVEMAVNQEIDVRAIKQMLEDVDYLVRRYGGISFYEGYMKVDNELFSLLGADRVIPVSCQITTVEDYPGTYNVVLQLAHFDPEQESREKLKAGKMSDFYNPSGQVGAPYDIVERTTDGFKQHMVRAEAFNDKLSTLELYPDLALPTYDQMRTWIRYAKQGGVGVAKILTDSVVSDAHGSPVGVEGWNWTAGDCANLECPSSDAYVDPDFYCAPSYQVGAEIVDTTIKAMLSGQAKYTMIAESGGGKADLAFMGYLGGLDTTAQAGADLYNSMSFLGAEDMQASGLQSLTSGEYFSGAADSKNPGTPQDVIIQLRKSGCTLGDIQYILDYSREAGLPVGVVCRWFLQEGGISQRTQPANNSHAGMGQLGSSAITDINRKLAGKRTPWGASSVGLDDRFPRSDTGRQRAIWASIQYMKMCYDGVSSLTKGYTLRAEERLGLGVLSYTSGAGSVQTALKTCPPSMIVAMPEAVVKYAKGNKMSRYLPNTIRGFMESDRAYTQAFNALTSGQSIEDWLSSTPSYKVPSNLTLEGVMASNRRQSVPSSSIPSSLIAGGTPPVLSNTGQLSYVSADATSAFIASDDEGPSYCTVDQAFYDKSGAGRDMFHDMRKYSKAGRLLQAFPTYCLLLVDGGRWLRFWRLYDKWYGMAAINSIEIAKSRKSPVDVAVVKIANMYGHLTTRPAEQEMDDYMADKIGDSHRWGSEFVWNSFKESFVGPPSKDTTEIWARYANSLMLRPGARMHIRMGYGSNASHLPVVFNGVISEVPPGDDLLEVTALGDGVELTHKLKPTGSTDKEVYKSTSWFGGGTNPKEIITRLFAPSFVATVTHGGYAHDNPHGIEHFGAREYDKAVSRNGECGMNIYAVTNGAILSDDISNGQKTGPVKGVINALNLIPGWGAVDAGASNLLIGVAMEDATAWDVCTTAQRVAPEYILAVYPFELRSTLFYGKPHWPLRYEYTSDYLFNAVDGSATNPYTSSDDLDSIVEWKPFSQIHITSSTTNLISNGIRASSEDMYTQCQAIGTHNGFFNLDKQDNDRSLIMNLDTDIYQENQKLLYTTSGLYSTGSQKLKDLLNNLDLMSPFECRKALNTYAAQTLKESVKDMYGGDCLELGSPSMKPHDRVFLYDVRTQMDGVVEVKEVIHSLSFDTGMTTSWQPDLLASLIETADQMQWNWISLFGSRLASSFGLRMIIGALISRASVNNGLRALLSFREYVKAYASGDVVWAQRILNGSPDEGLSGIDDILGRYIRSDGQALSNRIDTAISSASGLSRLTEEIAPTFSQVSKDVVDLANQAGADAKYIESVVHPLVSWQEAYNALSLTKKIGDAIGDKLTAAAVGAAISTFKDTISCTNIQHAFGGRIPALGLLSAPIRGTALILSGSGGLSEWMERKLVARQCLVLRPLTIAGREFSAGIEGHAGCIVGDQPGFWDGVIQATVPTVRYSVSQYGTTGVTYSTGGGFPSAMRGIVALGSVFFGGMGVDVFDDDARQKSLFRDGQIRDLSGELSRAKAEQSAAVASDGGTNYDATGANWAKALHGRITSPFGMRKHPITGMYKMHTGVDIAAAKGTPIKAAASGVVEKASWNSVYGNQVIINHGGGVTTMYGHCERLLVQVGQVVKEGDQIATVGSTGNSTGPHLHFEKRVNGDAVSPM
jgi:murein DD-endopeptidase MepM/ murein hydrolase activator NlpD